MSKLSKSDSDIYHRVLLSGLSGSGKSTLAALLSESFNLIWIDLENSKDILTKLPQEWLDRIDYINIPDSASYPIGVQTLMILFKQGKANICEEHGKVDCALCKKDGKPFNHIDFSTMDENTILVVDGGTQLSASILAYVCKDKPVEYKPERDDWGGLRKYSEFFSSQFQAFPKNMILTCHAIEAEMENGVTKLVPAFGSKDMSTKISKAFSDVIYLDVKNRKHAAISSSTASNTVLTRSRSDFDISVLEVPSLIPLFKNEYARKEESKSPAEKAVGNLSKLSLGLGKK